MRVRAPRFSQSLVSGERFIDFVSPGANYSKLRCQLGCDIGKLLSFGVVTIRVSVYDRPVSIETKPFTVNVIGDSLISASQEDAKEKERISRVRENYRIYQSTVDITSFIQNEEAKRVTRSPEMVYEAIATSDSALVKSEKSLTPYVGRILTKRADTAEMRRLIKTGVDPATLRSKFPIEDPSSLGRAVTKSSKLPKGFVNKVIDSRVSMVGELYARVVGTPGVYKGGRVSSRYREVYFDVIIPNNALLSLSSLFFYMEAVNSSGIAVDFLSREVGLADIAQDIKRSRDSEEPVTLSRPVPPPRSEYYTAYRKVDKENELIILNAFGDPVITRDFNGASFSGRVTRRKSIERGRSEGGLDIVPFYPERNGDRLEIKIPNVPEDIVSISLQRRRPTYSEGFSNVSSDSYLVSEGSSVTLVDSSLFDDTHYEYRLRFVDRKSNVRYTANTVSYHFVSTNLSERMTANVSRIDPVPVSDLGSDVPQLTFTLSTEVREKGVEVIRQTLAAAGVSEETITSSLANPENYRKFIVYEVVRYNLRNGDVDSFGVFEDPTFTDDSALSSTIKSSVTPLNFFDRYKYVVRFGLRSPSSLAPDQQGAGTDSKTGKQYEYKAYKFKSRRLPTNLPSNAEMSKILRGSSVSNMDLIDIGTEVTVDFAPDKFQPRVYDLEARRSYVKSNLLSWRVDGATSIVDHFQVYAVADGVETLIGCAHPYSRSGLHLYEDFELYNRVGTVNYRVVPVLTNFTSSPGEAKVSITRRSNLPDFLQERNAS
jgi:hypothetical protein